LLTVLQDPKDPAAVQWCVCGAVVKVAADLAEAHRALAILDETARGGIPALGGKTHLKYRYAELAWDRDPVNHAEPLFLGAIARARRCT
jgi:hypothetical protein